MSTAWRSATVVALCQAMRETRDYSAAPILADALQDAEYGDEDVLNALRGNLPHWQAERLVALIYSDKTAGAVKRIEEIAEWLGPGAIYEREEYDTAIPMDYQRLMEVANDWVDGTSSTTQWMGESWQESFPGRAREFWENYQVVTGRKPPDGPRSVLLLHVLSRMRCHFVTRPEASARERMTASLTLRVPAVRFTTAASGPLPAALTSLS